VAGGGTSVGLVCSGDMSVDRSVVERLREAGAGGRYFSG
jgi:hypothetical protein